MKIYMIQANERILIQI